MKNPEVKMTEGFFRDRAHPNGPNRFSVKPYGFLTGFELVLDTPIPNMDASNSIILDAVLYINGQVISIKDVYSHHRSVSIG